MFIGQIADMDARVDPVKTAPLPRIDHHILVVEVEEDLVISVAIVDVPDVREHVLEDLVQVLDLAPLQLKL